MSELILIILATVLVNNFVLVKFLGLCPLLGASTRFETALGMSLATTFVLTLASGSSYLIDTYVLVPLGIEYLRLLSFILVIAGAVQFTELFVRHSIPILHQVLGRSSIKPRYSAEVCCTTSRFFMTRLAPPCG